jgi:hypothetical protein
MPRRASLIAFALLLAALGRSELARAQALTPTVAPAMQVNPERFVNGVDLGQSTRPINLMPLGVNYQDCIEDMILQFPVAVSGFDGSESLQIWASKSGDCTADTARGVGSNAVTTCWIVGQGFTAQRILTTTTMQFNVRVQDLVGPQNAPPSPPSFVQQGPSACNAQGSSFVGVPITIFFVPVSSGNNMVGTPYKIQVATDLVGPPPPVGVTSGVGDSLFTVKWTPNTDSDTQGYDVFVDPIPGQEDAAAPNTDATPTATLVCPDATVASTVLPEASTEGGDDGSSVDATSDAPSSDAGCFYEYVSGSTTGSSSGSSNNSCTSVVLTSAIVQDGGVPVQETDEAGNPIEGGLVPANGGISTIPSNYLVGAGSAGLTISDKNTGTFTITGLRNGPPGYNVVVAAVDGSGNVGPPSMEVCDYPAPVNDFWNLYRQAGGRAGGGCALGALGEPGPAVSGLALVAAASALARRRRVNRRETLRS